MPNTDSTRKFVKRFFDADARLPNDNLHTPEKVSSNSSIPNRTNTCVKRRKITQNSCNIGDILKETLVRNAQQTGVYASPVQIATKVLHLHPHKTTVVYKVYETDREAK
jgi:hypothetical protein